MADYGTQFWLPFVVIGVAAIFLGLTTKPGRRSHPDRGNRARPRVT